MPRIVPWIEAMVQSYSPVEGTGCLKADVVGVGQMSQSQAESNKGPSGLLYLSDGLIQIPALLTASAWDQLQEQEERESFSSLLNTTISIQRYQLQFHMAAEQTRCHFFLSIGELATTSAGPFKTNTPPCTSLPSVQLKICQTWRSLKGQEGSQESPCDLSELLGAWQHDCLQTILDDVQEKLTRRSSSPQPGPSTVHPPVSITATTWDLDRVRLKGLKTFMVPMKQLLIPENLQPQDEQQQQVKKVQLWQDTTPSADEDQGTTSVPQNLDVHQQTVHHVPEEEEQMLDEDLFTGTLDGDITPLDNPWDMFPRPCDPSSSSETSPQLTQTSPTIFTSTQLPDHTPQISQQPSLSKAQHSFFPPYQNPPASSSSCSSSSAAPVLTEPSNPPLPVGESDKDTENADRSKCRKTKRRRSWNLNSETLSVLVEEEHEVVTSPPSWLFESQDASQKGGAYFQSQRVRKQSPRIHSDGRTFAYSYQACGDDLLGFSRFSVEDPCLRWAVQYLLMPKNAPSSCKGSIPGGSEVSST